MGIFIELLSNLVQTFILAWFISNFFGYKYEGIKRKIGFAFVWIITFAELTFVNSIIVYEGMVAGISIITLIVYANIYLKSSLFSHSFIAVFSYAIVFTVSSIILFIGSALTRHTVNDLIAISSVWRSIMLLIARIAEFTIFKFVIKVNDEYVLTKKEWCLFVTMPLLTWISVTIITNAAIASNTILVDMLYIAIIMLLINGITYFFMYKIRQDSNTKMEYQLLKMQYDNIQDMETNMKALYDSTYSLKHDLDKHFLAIKEMAYHNECKEIGKYVENIIEKSSGSVQKIVFTNNDIFNAIINTKLEICRQRDIKTSISIDNEAVAMLKNEYIAVLFGNIFDNAIEATEKARYRYIVFSVSQKREYISITLENTYDINFSDINLSTTKHNKEEHGFGTKNVRKIVEENNGMIQTFTKDKNIFCCDILLQK